MYIYQKKIRKTISPFLFLFPLVLAGAFLFWKMDVKEKNNRKVLSVENQPAPAAIIETKNVLKDPATVPRKALPEPVDMTKLKSQGCVADGLFSDFNPEEDKYFELVNRSNCYYLHRAIDTWLSPPDFGMIEQEINRINKKPVVYGMFIAEAIHLKINYIDQRDGTAFDFEKMCKNDSEGAWGPRTCKPDFASKEYRRYIAYITENAIDLGVQSFTFGQIYMQEGSEREYAEKIINDIRSYANKKGVDVVIGAQTGSIQNERYLSMFDYIEGGVGLATDGSVENGPCLSTRGSCWALLWHENFSSKAKNVLLHLDWSGIKSDDLDIFARMTPEKRAKTLENLYAKFNTKKTGFMMPLLGYLDNENGGCRGPKKKLYSPDMEYGCRDEKTINDILAKSNVLLNKFSR